MNQTFHVVLAGDIAHHIGAVAVGADEVVGAHDRPIDMRLGREMNHRVAATHRLGYSSPIGDIALDKPDPFAVDDVVGSTVRFTLDGRTSTAIVASDGAPILDHVLAIRPEGPFSCRSGACASCRAYVTEGEVRMDRNWSLSSAEVAAGQILTCQSHPVSDVVELTYDV